MRRIGRIGQIGRIKENGTDGQIGVKNGTYRTDGTYE